MPRKEKKDTLLHSPFTGRVNLQGGNAARRFLLGVLRLEKCVSCDSRRALLEPFLDVTVHRPVRRQLGLRNRTFGSTKL